MHGDYRLENTMLAPDTPEIVAVLDWEMSTLGDPLTDLGLFLVYWVHWGNDDERVRSPPVARPACPASSASTTSPRATPRQPAATSSNLDFYIVFAFYKLAVILEGINARFLMGKTVGEGLRPDGRHGHRVARRRVRASPTGPKIPALRG